MKYQPRATLRLAHTVIHGQKLNLQSIRRGIQRRTFLSQLSQYSEDPTMGKDKVQFQLKTPKGTKDCKYLLKTWRIGHTDRPLAGDGKDMVIRDRIFSTITNVFKRHGAVTIDT